MQTKWCFGRGHCSAHLTESSSARSYSSYTPRRYNVSHTDAFVQGTLARTETPNDGDRPDTDLYTEIDSDGDADRGTDTNTDRN